MTDATALIASMRANPGEAEYLMRLAQEIVDLRWQNYENMAGWKAEAFQPVAWE